jgi:Tol biopolymer transport system component
MLGLGVVAAVTVALHCPAASPAGAALPTWSPDSAVMAFAAPQEETAAIAIARPTAARPSDVWLSYDSPPVKLAWSARGNAIAFQKRTGAIEVLTLGRPSFSRELVHAEFGKTTELGDWSPSGRELVFVRDGHIHVLDSSTGAIRYLVDGFHPTWSPDGREIAYASGGELRAIGPDGRGARTIAGGLAPVEAIAWSPDAARLAFVGRVIGIVPRAGGVPEYTVPAEPPLAWRANGIFYNLEQVAPVQTAPWRFDPDTGSATRLLRLPVKYDAHLTAVSPDGRRVGYELDVDYRPVGIRVIDAGRDEPLVACTGSARADRVRGSRLNDVIRVPGGGVDRVTCGRGRDTVYADRRDIVAHDCERVLRS